VEDADVTAESWKKHVGMVASKRQTFVLALVLFVTIVVLPSTSKYLSTVWGMS
jgi:hypothetical protein